MAIRESDLAAIIKLLQDRGGPLSAAEIEERLELSISRRALQNRLKRLVITGRLAREGSGRSTRYQLPHSMEPGRSAAGATSSTNEPNDPR